MGRIALLAGGTGRRTVVVGSLAFMAALAGFGAAKLDDHHDRSSIASSRSAPSDEGKTLHDAALPIANGSRRGPAAPEAAFSWLSDPSLPQASEVLNDSDGMAQFGVVR
jgi:hypothetical protein